MKPISDYFSSEDIRPLPENPPVVIQCLGPCGGRGTVSDRWRCSECGPVTVAGYPLRAESVRAFERACRNHEKRSSKRADSNPRTTRQHEREELRQRAAVLRQAGNSVRAIASILGVSRSAVDRLLRGAVVVAVAVGVRHG